MSKLQTVLPCPVPVPVQVQVQVQAPRRGVKGGGASENVGDLVNIFQHGLTSALSHWPASLPRYLLDLGGTYIVQLRAACSARYLMGWVGVYLVRNRPGMGREASITVALHEEWSACALHLAGPG